MENRGSIVACIAGVQPGESVCDYASWWSKSAGKTLKLLHTIEHETANPSTDLSGSLGLGDRDELLSEYVALEHEQSRLSQRKARVLLETAKIRAKGNGVEDPQLVLRHGKLQDNLLDLVKETEAVVIGRYGQKHQQNPKNSVGHRVEAVVRSIERPVLVVSEPFVKPESVLLAWDGSSASKKALEYVASGSVFHGLQIHVVHVGSEEESSNSLLEQAVSKLQKSHPNAKAVGLSGETAPTILAYLSQHDISLTVMGAFGHHWLRDMIVGSFTSKMLTLSQKPLLLVR